MDKKQQDAQPGQLDEGVSSLAPQGIADTQATESSFDDPLMGNGDRGPLAGNGDR
jgi:hypothetical protein